MTKLSGRALVLVNPAAGAGTAGTSADAVVATLRSLGFEASLMHTSSAEHAVHCAAQAAPDDLVLPLGGDGMISFVAQGCVASGALLTPLPAGRGNDFVRGLGLPRDTLAVTRTLSTASERVVDVGRIGERTFVGTATIGFDALTNERANRRRRIRGAVVYTAAGVGVALRMKPARFEVRTDGPEGQREERFTGWNLSIGNSGRHGGGLTATPGADLADGLLDVVVTQGSRFDQLAASALLERGGHHVRLPYVQQWRATQIEVTATDRHGAPLEVFADGDPISSTPATIRVEPGALRLFY
ncbi:diacylglycerol kinase family protein [Yimella sp. cx-51]|uniref:diacylglycerol/lipid kinase family protein n=1 Tax=Yimella sp. cx-51 TaxID=2770551 RepID=UPI00165E4ECE|nr:diacylglycerol kinase family protein [Yimella sp. cx-51]MBC9955821.1 diacylglycerol kinase family lipid kinase [Yimella sp. cx-51]QTH37627.1 diacylglycerol kinase family lipid kinase [Yimella sp. cx-51]